MLPKLTLGARAESSAEGRAEREDLLADEAGRSAGVPDATAAPRC